MATLLGITSYAAGLIPLMFSSSKSALDQFSLLGAGLLVGTALGVILPEGIEALIRSSSESETVHDISPTLALPLLLGFSFMLLLDQIISPDGHHGRRPSVQLKSAGLPLHTNGGGGDEVDFDAELSALEREEGVVIATPSTAGGPMSGNHHHFRPHDVALGRKQAMARTAGLVVHALADGFALGISSLTDTVSKSLSVVVFLALAVHKAPTSLALSTSLLATGITREECKKHLLIFAAATPVGALASYFVFSIMKSDKTNWTAIALLASGGSFVYVATVLQSASYNTAASEMTRLRRSAYLFAGILLPFLLNLIIGHNH
ncbi:Zinc/iron permease [Amanita muscaria]